MTPKVPTLADHESGELITRYVVRARSAKTLDEYRGGQGYYCYAYGWYCVGVYTSLETAKLAARLHAITEGSPETYIREEMV